LEQLNAKPVIETLKKLVKCGKDANIKSLDLKMGEYQFKIEFRDEELVPKRTRGSKKGEASLRKIIAAEMEKEQTMSELRFLEPTQFEEGIALGEIVDE
jgi:hypothetical protein